MSKELSVLQDIQNNTSEFNIKLHMGEVIAIAIMNTLLVDDNMKIIGDLVHTRIEPSEMKTTLIAHAFEPLIMEYLSSDMGIDEDFYEDVNEQLKEQK